MVSTKLLTYILYHLRTAIASRTLVLCWLLFLYSFLVRRRTYTKER
nr:MAG TPA: hypothetical protein [Caudoviricetes sp.]